MKPEGISWKCKGAELIGSLTVVGTGIALGHITREAEAFIRDSEKVLYLVADPVTSSWIAECNPSAEDLFPFYSKDKNRLTTYLEMVDQILLYVRQNLRVCAVFYGHPGVFVFPSHEAILRARSEGYDARMLPGISSEDCLFADLGIDPGRSGCQNFEATDLLVYRRKFDTGIALILWQVGVLGRMGYEGTTTRANLKVLADVLISEYGTNHKAVIYEAAQYPVCDPVIEWTTLDNLPNAMMTAISTLYIPPKCKSEVDLQMISSLGISLDYIRKKTHSPTLYDPSNPPIQNIPRVV